MVPGFVQVGVLAVLFQSLVIAGVYGYLKWRRSDPYSEAQTRAKRILCVGVGLAALGQLVGLGTVGSLRTAPLLSLQQAIFVQNAGLIVTLIGYVVVVAGFVLYSRTST
jgi:hypothetical protein